MFSVIAFSGGLFSIIPCVMPDPTNQERNDGLDVSQPRRDQLIGRYVMTTPTFTLHAIFIFLEDVIGEHPAAYCTQTD